MKSLRCLVVLAACIGFLQWSTLSIGQEPKSTTEIAHEFPGYHVLTLSDRDDDTRAFLTRRFPKSDSSVVRADFDADGHSDYAALLKSDTADRAKLVVLLCSSDSHCRRVYDLDLGAYSQITYLRPIARGSRVSGQDSAGRSLIVKLNSTGIRVIYYEKGEVVLYWSKKLGKIVEVQTKD